MASDIVVYDSAYGGAPPRSFYSEWYDNLSRGMGGGMMPYAQPSGLGRVVTTGLQAVRAPIHLARHSHTMVNG